MQNRSKNLIKAKEILLDNGYTAVALLGDYTYTSRERGVSPLLLLLDSGRDMSGASAADRVVGKAAAMIYVKLGIRELYADVISKHALDVLFANGIVVVYRELTDAIRNRSGDGFCPMESAVLDISDIDEAILAVRQKLASL